MSELREFSGHVVMAGDAAQSCPTRVCQGVARAGFLALPLSCAGLVLGLAFSAAATAQSTPPVPPVITNAPATAIVVSVGYTGVFATLEAFDADSSTQAWSITGGDDADKFNLDAMTGELSFKRVFGKTDDANGDGSYVLEVGVNDEVPNLTTAAVTVELNEPFVYEKGSSVVESIPLGLETELRGRSTPIDTGATVTDEENDKAATVIFELALTNAAGERLGVGDERFSSCRLQQEIGNSSIADRAFTYSEVLRKIRDAGIPVDTGLDLGKELSSGVGPPGVGIAFRRSASSGGTLSISDVRQLIRTMMVRLASGREFASDCGSPLPVDRDIGEHSTLRVTIVPVPGSAPQIARQEYRLQITPVNDPPEAMSPFSADDVVLSTSEKVSTQTFSMELFTDASPVETGQELSAELASLELSPSYPAAAINVNVVDELVTEFSVSTSRVSFKIPPLQYGEVSFSIRLKDDGGTADGGDDSTDFGPYRVRVLPVDNPPRFELDPAEVRVSEGASSFEFSYRDADNGEGDPGILVSLGNTAARLRIPANPLLGHVLSDNFIGGPGDTISNIRLAPHPDTNGEWTFDVELTENDEELTVSDDNNNGEIEPSEIRKLDLTATRELVLVVAPINDAPVLELKKSVQVLRPGATPELPELKEFAQLFRPGLAPAPLSLDITDPDLEARKRSVSDSDVISRSVGWSPEVSQASSFPPHGGYEVGSILRFHVAAATKGTDAASIDVNLVDALSRENDMLTMDGVTIIRGAGNTLRFRRGNVSAGGMEFLRHRAPGVAADSTRLQVFEATVSSYLSEPALRTFLYGAVGVSVDAGDPGVTAERKFAVSFRDAGNDGTDGMTGPSADSDVLELNVLVDWVPPEAPTGAGSLVVEVEPGATEALLVWRPAQDRAAEREPPNPTRTGLPHGGLRHAIGITDVTGITGDDRCGAGKHVAEIFADEADFVDGLYDDTSGYAVLDTVESVRGGASTRTSNGYENKRGGVRAVFRITRRDATLIPGREYCFALSASDLAGNEPVVYQSAIKRMRLSSDEEHLDRVRDELAAVVNDDIAGHCGSDEFGDADGDGIPNNVEVLLGLECRAGAPGWEIAYVGIRPMEIRFTPDPDLWVTSEGVVVYPGSGPLTELVGLGADCDGGTGGCALTPYRSHDVKDTATACADRGQWGSVLRTDDSSAGNCESADNNGNGDPELGSFGRRVLWVARDGYHNWASTTRAVYVRPPVGLDLTSVPVSGASASVPASVSVSDDVAVSGVEFSVDFEISGEGVSATDSLDEDNRSRLVALTLPDPTTSSLVVGLMIEDANVTMAPAELTPPMGLPSTAWFTLGNAALELRPDPVDPATLRFRSFTLYVGNTREPSPYYVTPDEANRLSFELVTSPPFGYEVSAEILAGPSLMHPSTVVMAASSTARSGDTVELLAPIGLQVGDLLGITASTGDGTIAGVFVSVVSQEVLDLLDAEEGSALVSGEGAPVLLPGGYALSASMLSVLLPSTAADVPAVVIEGPPRYAGTGIFDFTIKGLPSGGVASVLIELKEPSPQVQALYKYDNDNDIWSPFTTGDMAPFAFDRYYSAPFPCPGLGARRGDEAGEWREASVSGVRSGDGCLLIEIRDGSVNDADGVRNGIIHDPNALGGGADIRHGGGGALGPAWLALLGLGAVAAAARRRNPRNSRVAGNERDPR